MNILFIYNLENIDYENITFKIEESFKELIDKNTIIFKRKEKINVRSKADVYIILSDETDETNDYFKQIKVKENTLVLTNNLECSHILSLVNHTKNICYMRNDVRIIVRKIYSIYMEDKHENI